MRTIFFLSFLISTFYLNAQSVEKPQSDTLFLGEWQLANPADAKMLKTAGETFLKDKITFGQRNKYFIPNERNEWEWRYNADNGILTIIDREMEEESPYKVASVTKDELILLWGRTDYKLVYRRVSK